MTNARSVTDRTGSIERLRGLAARLSATHLRELLTDGGRARRFALEAGPLEADFARQRVDQAVWSELAAFAAASGLEAARRRLFEGGIVNPTENRAALHTALRGVGGDAAIAAEVAGQRARPARLAAALRAGELRGFSGGPIAALVSIGIGGSDLGPRLVCDALREPGGFDVRFVANVDPDDLERELAGLDPATTAFAIVSKTFTTRETLANAEAARRWLKAAGCPEPATAAHFIGITAAPAAATAWGIAPDRLLRFWDWVGGRYSLWSSVGLSIAAACGDEAHASLLDGAAEIDRHFRDAPLADNLPARLGMFSVWNRSFLGCPSQAVIPYAERLRLLPAYLQQLVMESNGKSARLDGGSVDLPTSPIVWGTSGTNAQHSFFQQLHQGPDVVPVDFIVAQRPRLVPDVGDDRHRVLVANCLAQSAALALGGPADTRGTHDAHRRFEGDRPSTVLVVPQVDARALGALLACYEHATFTAATMLGINPFDQFGVELGKSLARSTERLLADGGDAPGEIELDASTRALARRLAEG